MMNNIKESIFIYFCIVFYNCLNLTVLKQNKRILDFDFLFEKKLIF